MVDPRVFQVETAKSRRANDLESLDPTTLAKTQSYEASLHDLKADAISVSTFRLSTLTGDERYGGYVDWHNLLLFPPQRTSSVDSVTLKGSPTSDPYDFLLGSIEDHQNHVGRTSIMRFLIFLFLEVAFVGFIAKCLYHPIELGPTFDSNLMKGGFTAAVIAWQFLAGLALQDMIVTAFSSEWYRQLITAERAGPNIDQVSLVTSSLLDQIKYFFTWRATLPYRVAFVLLFVSAGLGSIAPGAVTITTSSQSSQAVGNITNMTFTSTHLGGPLFDFLTTTFNIYRLERSQNFPFKFEMEKNVIIPWPDPSSMGTLQEPIYYNSDVVTFQHQCHWEMPTFVQTPAGTVLGASGYSWMPFNDLDNTEFLGAIMPLYRINTSDLSNPNASALFKELGLALASPPLSAYVFIGASNSTPYYPTELPDYLANNSTINLEGLPFIFSGTGFNYSVPTGDQDSPLDTTYFHGNALTVLVCAPNVKILNGQITLASNMLIHTPINSQLLGNINPEAVDNIFSHALLNVFEPDTDDSSNYLDVYAAQAFLANASFEWEKSSHPLDLLTVAQNLDMNVQLSSKAFLQNSRNSSGNLPSPNVTAVHFTGNQDIPAITATPEITVVTCITIGVAMLLASLLLLHQYYVVSYPITMELILKFQVLFHKNLKTPPVVIEQQSIILPLLGFFFLEFILVLLGCLLTQKPMIFITNWDQAGLQGGMTILLLLWQATATQLARAIPIYVFSTHWAVQLNNGQSMTSKPDKVSLITSGIFDYVQFSLQPNGGVLARMSCIILLLLSVIGTLLPASIGISLVPMNKSIPMEISVFPFINGSSNSSNENLLENEELFNQKSILKLEKNSNISFGFDINPNWISQWPLDHTNITYVVKYPSDVVFYNYSCQWNIPQKGNEEKFNSWMINNILWDSIWQGEENFTIFGGVIPLQLAFHNSSVTKGTRAYLLLGTNQTLFLSSDQSLPMGIDLSGLPATYSPTGFDMAGHHNTTTFCTAQLATVLLCEPNYKILRGDVLLYPNQTLDVQPLNQSAMGDISSSTIEFMLSEGFHDHEEQQEDGTEDFGIVNKFTISNYTLSLLFSQVSDLEGQFIHGMQLVDLSMIQNNLAQTFQAVSKPYSTGLFVHTDNISDTSVSKRLVYGNAVVSQIALTAQKQLTFISVGIFILLLLLLGFVVTNPAIHSFPTFCIQNILCALDL